MKTRTLVTGKYVDSDTYVLFNEDGSVFQEINAGIPFRIANQFRQWYPIKEKKKNGFGTIIICKKFNENGTIIDEFPLLNNKKGFWALTAGSARKGVFHRYYEPQNAIEKQLVKMGTSFKVISNVYNIDVTLKLGGELNSSSNNKWGYVCITDGQTSYSNTPCKPFYNFYQQDISFSLNNVRIYEASYLIYYYLGTYMNGQTHRNILKILLTPYASEREVLKKLSKIKL